MAHSTSHNVPHNYRWYINSSIVDMQMRTPLLVE